MSTPVPLMAIPRRARPKTRAASTTSAASRPQRAATTSGVQAGHGPSQLVHPVHVAQAELAVDQALGEQHVQQPAVEHRIRPGDQLEVEVRARRRLGPPRVDHDQLQPAPAGVAQRARGVVDREAGEVAALQRDQRVGAGQQPDVGVLEALAAAEPAPEPALGDPLRRLVDRHRRVQAARARRAPERDAERERQRARGGLRAAEERDRVRPMLGRDRRSAARRPRASRRGSAPPPRPAGR